MSSAQEFEARILLVEDDPEARARLEPLLARRWSVTLAERGDAELATPFDLVIAEVRTSELTALRKRNAQQEEVLADLKARLQARDEFLSAASHELRTPITTLSLQTDGLLSLPASGANGGRRPIDDRMLRRLTAIRRQVVRLNQLVDQLLDVSRLIEGRLELRPEQIDLQALVIEAIDLMRESATQAGSPVLLRLRPEVVGHWDRIRIGQVITNLLSNAIKFGCGRPIEVELDADDNSARVQVRDAGEGILPQEQERIFQRFERATSIQRHPGMGLGLWICKQIVEASHGTISVESVPGHGSTFSVELPRASLAAAAAGFAFAEDPDATSVR